MLHNIGVRGDRDNLKFMSLDGYFEAVFDGEGNLLTEKTDPKNMGTFNYSGDYEEGIPIYILHFLYDIVPWWASGTSSEDKTNLFYRLWKTVEPFLSPPKIPYWPNRTLPQE